MKHIDFYYDFRSPFAYFAFRRFHIFTDRGAQINYRPVFVSALINLQANRNPQAEVTSDSLTPEKRANFMADIFRLIEYWDIPFAPPEPTPPICTKAMVIATKLAAQGVDQSAWVESIFTGVWLEQKSAEDDEFLNVCLEKSNYDLTLADDAESEGIDLLIKNTIAAHDLGVFGTPTFICDEQLYFGSDRMELLASKL